MEYNEMFGHEAEIDTLAGDVTGINISASLLQT